MTALNPKIKHREWQIGFKKRKKQAPTICYPQETHFRVKDTGWKRMENVFYGNGKAEVTILRENRCQKKSHKDEEYYIMIKGSIKEEDFIPVNIYASNIGAPIIYEY